MNIVLLALIVGLPVSITAMNHPAMHRYRLSQDAIQEARAPSIS